MGIKNYFKFHSTLDYESSEYRNSFEYKTGDGSLFEDPLLPLAR